MRQLYCSNCKVAKFGERVGEEGEQIMQLFARNTIFRIYSMTDSLKQYMDLFFQVLRNNFGCTYGIFA